MRRRRRRSGLAGRVRVRPPRRSAWIRRSPRRWWSPARYSRASQPPRPRWPSPTLSGDGSSFRTPPALSVGVRRFRPGRGARPIACGRCRDPRPRRPHRSRPPRSDRTRRGRMHPHLRRLRPTVAARARARRARRRRWFAVRGDWRGWRVDRWDASRRRRSPSRPIRRWVPRRVPTQLWWTSRRLLSSSVRRRSRRRHPPTRLPGRRPPFPDSFAPVS